MTAKLTVCRGRVIETALWCDVCMLPSGVSFELLLVASRPASTVPVQYMIGRWCVECSNRITLARLDGDA